MDYQAILKDFVSTKVKPVYFLTGDEDYFIDSLVKEAESHLVPEAQRDFNLQVVYGKDTTTRALVEYCRQFPFMGDKKIGCRQGSSGFKRLGCAGDLFQTTGTYYNFGHCF